MAIPELVKLVEQALETAKVGLVTASRLLMKALVSHAGQQQGTCLVLVPQLAAPAHASMSTRAQGRNDMLSESTGMFLAALSACTGCWQAC
jgi:uncharacterized caspase-like protein